jgi:cytochrome bd-type quinol oxidase subunit 2
MPAMYLRWNRIFLVYVPESLQIKQKNQVSLLWLFGLTTCAAVIMGTLRVLADSIYFDNALAFSFPILLWSIVPLLMILGTLKPKWLYHSIPCTFAILAILLLPFLFREDYRQNAWTAVVYSASLYCILIVHLVFLRVCGYRLITYPKV